MRGSESDEARPFRPCVSVILRLFRRDTQETSSLVRGLHCGDRYFKARLFCLGDHGTPVFNSATGHPEHPASLRYGHVGGTLGFRPHGCSPTGGRRYSYRQWGHPPGRSVPGMVPRYAPRVQEGKRHVAEAGGVYRQRIQRELQREHRLRRLLWACSRAMGSVASKLLAAGQGRQSSQSWAQPGIAARTDCVANDVSLSSICRQRECLHTRPVGD